MLSLFRRSRRMPALLHFTHAKAGSTWVEGLLARLFPGQIAGRLGSEWFKSRPNSGPAEPPTYLEAYRALRFEPGRVYPGMFLTHGEFLTRPDFQAARRFAVIRDPRDTIVSLYFSLKVSHALDAAGQIQTARTQLNTLSVEEGLAWVFDRDLARFAEIQRSWLESGEIVVRYEDLLPRDVEEFSTLFLERLALPLDAATLRTAVEACRFEKVYQRKLGETDVNSHARQGLPGDWRHHFTPRLCRLFRERTGDLLVRAGYEPDDSWVDAPLTEPAASS